MKIYKSLDFESAKKRIEKNVAGDYLVHLEDYESLNDLIRRSVRTKSRFDLPAQETGKFDDVFSVDTEKQPQTPNIEQIFSNEVTEETKAPQAEQSEGKGAAISEETSEEKMQ